MISTFMKVLSELISKMKIWDTGKSIYDLATSKSGQLIAYATVYTDSNGTVVSTSTAFSDNAIGLKSYDIVNLVEDILTGTSGTILVKTKGIVGMIEADCILSGYGGTGNIGIWWGKNYNTLPSGITLLGSDREPLTSGPGNGIYGGNSNKYIYKVDSNENLEFYVNPSFVPYNGPITFSNGGTGCKLIVKVYAK